MARVLVTGATGRQGRAVARALLDRGHDVRVLVRPESVNAADPLLERGAEIALGYYDDTPSLERAMDDVEVVFAVTTPIELGTRAEVRHGRAMIRAATNAGVGHFVFSSFASANRSTQVPELESKGAIEKHLAGAAIPWTVLGSTCFMDDLLPMSAPGLRDGRLRRALPRWRAVQMLALVDFTSFVAHVIAERYEFRRVRLELASDALSGKRMASVLSRVLRRPIDYAEQSLQELERVSAREAALYRWLDQEGFRVNIPYLHTRYCEVTWHTFEDWAEAQDWTGINAPVGRSPRRRAA